MATDFRSGRDFPRRARERYGGYDHLLRVFDKGRAAQAGTIFDYVYPCPIDRDVMAQWGSRRTSSPKVDKHDRDEAAVHA